MKYAKPEWRDGQPYSAEYDDVYFSADNGVEETEHVFVKHNHLKERFSQCGNDVTSFVVAETGFGSGLNFLVTVKHWLELVQNNTVLHFYSIENTPFKLDDLIKAHKAWPELQYFAEELQANYVAASYGYHCFELFAGRVKLVLMIGDVEDMLTQMNSSVNAWFLDGFAPGLNESMWSQSVFEQIQRLSVKGTTFSTYTAVGEVRRGLMTAGFTVNKESGCGKKRHMLAGIYEQEALTQSLEHPWYEGQQALLNKPQKACVIGAGIAGLTTAWSLVKRGYQVEIIEQGDQFGYQASGNPQAMLMPRLSLQDAADAEFYTSAYFYALRCLKQLDPHQQGWKQSGGMQLPSSARIKKQILQYPESNELVKVLEAREGSELSGLDIKETVHYYPLAASLQPLSVLKSLIDDMGDALTIHYQKPVKSFHYENNEWVLYDSNSDIISTTELLICTSSWQTKRFQQFQHLYLQPARGQITQLESTGKSRPLKLPLSYDGYMLPSMNDQHVIGASFEPEDCSTEIREKEHLNNLADVNQWFAGMFDKENIVGGRASVRAVTPDRVPVVGAAPDLEEYTQMYKDLYKGKPAHKYSKGCYLPKLYVNTGHGARGFTSAFLSAELLVATICNEPLPVSNRVRYALHSARFLIRSFKKRASKKHT